VSREGQRAVKGHSKESRRRNERKLNPIQEKGRLKTGLMGVHRKEGRTTLGKIKGKRPRRGPRRNSVQGRLDVSRSDADQGIRRPDGQVVSEEGDIARSRKNRRKIIDEDQEEDGTKYGALGDSHSQPKGGAGAAIVDHRSPPVAQECLNPSDEARRKTRRKELRKESRVPNRIKRTSEVDGSQHRAFRGLGRLKAIGNRLGKEKTLVSSRTTAAETSLRMGQEGGRFQSESKAKEDHLLQDFGKTGSKGDRAIRRGKTGRLTRLKNRNDVRKLPGVRKDRGGQG